MHKGRLEAFSDGVLAIIITIMVLEFKVPHSPDFVALAGIWPTFFSYVLSFVFLAIYWNNHHHMMQAVHRVNGQVLWANMHLLFWLSLVPFATAWLGESVYSAPSVTVYAALAFLCGFAYWLLQGALLACHGRDSAFGQAVGRDYKGWASLGCYAVAIALGMTAKWVSVALFVLVSLMWLVPDRRMERAFAAHHPHDP